MITLKGGPTTTSGALNDLLKLFQIREHVHCLVVVQHRIRKHKVQTLLTKFNKQNSV